MTKKVKKEEKEFIIPEQKSKPKIELVSYSIKMVIPTGAYANIQPEIIVKAGTVEDAHDYIAPHLNKLWKEYFMVSERKQEPVKPNYPTGSTATPESPVTVQQPPVAAVAFAKASSAISSCLSQEALDIIATQIKNSVKLDDKEKDKLYVLLLAKQKNFNGTETTK